MNTVTLKYDAHNPIATETLDYILSLGVFEKTEYNTSPSAPEGYTTSEEFRRCAAVKVNTFCEEHGIL